RGCKLSIGIAGCHADRLGSQIEPDQSAASGQMQSSLGEWQNNGHVSRHRACGEPFDKIRNLPGRGKPHAIVGSAADVSERARQVFESMWPADNVGVQRNSHDQWALHAFSVHDFKSINYHVGKFGTFAFARDDLWDVVELLRVGYGQNSSSARFHPDRLVVMTPVKQITVAGLLQ